MTFAIDSYSSAVSPIAIEQQRSTMKRITLALRTGRELRKRREALGISQEKFAGLVEMHRTYYSSLERGLKNMRVETLERVCSALKTHMWEVMKEAESVTVQDRNSKR
jgi:transcriptional regulator with XRE-family HTH domain